MMTNTATHIWGWGLEGFKLIKLVMMLHNWMNPAEDLGLDFEFDLFMIVFFLHVLVFVFL